jgi:hypothetical protein
MTIRSVPGKFPGVGDVLYQELSGVEYFELIETTERSQAKLMKEVVKRSVRTTLGERFVDDAKLAQLNVREYTDVLRQAQEVNALDPDPVGNSDADPSGEQ